MSYCFERCMGPPQTPSLNLKSPCDRSTFKSRVWQAVSLTRSGLTHPMPLGSVQGQWRLSGDQGARGQEDSHQIRSRDLGWDARRSSYSTKGESRMEKRTNHSEPVAVVGLCPVKYLVEQSGVCTEAGCPTAQVPRFASEGCHL